MDMERELNILDYAILVSCLYYHPLLTMDNLLCGSLRTKIISSNKTVYFVGSISKTIVFTINAYQVR